MTDTPAAPDRCGICGHGRQHQATHGTVTLFRGHPMCGACREGTEELIADGWAFDDLTGALTDPTGRTQAWQDQRRAAVRDLYAVLTRYLAAADLTIEIFNSQSGVSLALPTGERVHVFPPGAATFPVPDGAYSAILFQNDRPTGYQALPADEAGMLHQLSAGLDTLRTTDRKDT